MTSDMRAYQFSQIHLSDPGHEMEPFGHPAQVFGNLSTVSGLGTIENERPSVLSQAIRIWVFRHRVGRDTPLQALGLSRDL